MHGSICVILKKFVEQSHGKETWKEILRLAGHDGLVLSPIQSYPDEAVFAIVGATCEHLEVDMQTGLEAVGKFAAPELVRFARGMLHPDWKTFELLANIETLIQNQEYDTESVDFDLNVFCIDCVEYIPSYL